MFVDRIASRMSGDIEEWFEGGERLFVELSNGFLASVFARVEGAGPMLTLLHGCPTCSFDWHAIAPHLACAYRLLTPDFLGFGDSDKPRRPYRIDDQADVVEAAWAHFGVERTGLVAHDYGGVVALELLARHTAGTLPVNLTGIVFLNGGLYPDATEPLGIQRVLRTPVAGAVAARLITGFTFRRTLNVLFSDAHPPDDDLIGELWTGVTRRGGRGVLHRLADFANERDIHTEHWRGALEAADPPRRFVWGMADPIAGAPVADQVRAGVPHADLVALDDVGHYPHLEAPERLGEEVAGFFGESKDHHAPR